MKCPKCQYEPTMREMQASLGTCPSCGVIYEKYFQALKRQAAISVQQQKKPTVESSATTPPAGQPQQVVITDIRMNFHPWLFSWSSGRLPPFQP